MQRPPLLQFQLRTLLVATVLIAATLLSLVLVPQFLAREARLQVLRMDVDQVARLAATHVDGDLHRELLTGTADDATLARARVPLIRLHERWPEAYYVYTMGIIDGQARFILDTAQDAQFAASHDGLKASRYLEPYEQREEYRDDWLQRLSTGQTYVTPGFQVDDYGMFLSGHAPIFDSAGQVAGFVGVDFGLDYYLSQEAHFRRIERASGGVALLLSVLLGYLHARRQHAQQAEVRRHYHSSMQDPLTGLPNRRGAMSAINELWSTPEVHSHAALLVDVDHFKLINDTHGHKTGDDVLRALALALTSSVRPGDITARLGGDEFLIFARDCDQHGAEQIAARLLAAVRAVESPTRFTVSVGLGIATNLQGGFDLLYRHADSALYRAKGSGRNRFSSYEEAVAG